MPQYQRAFVPGGTYFFTVVTIDHRPILTSEHDGEVNLLSQDTTWMSDYSILPLNS